MGLREIVSKWRAMPRAGRIAAWTAVVLSFILLFCLLALPPILRTVLAGQLGKHLHRAATVEKVRVNPLKLTVTIEGISVRDRQGDGEFFSLAELHADFQASSLFKRALIVEALRLKEPRCTIIREDAHRYNFSDLVVEKKKEEQAAPGGPFLFSLNNIEVTDGSLVFEDRPQKTTHTVRELSLGLPFVSNLDHLVEIYVEPAFQAVINDTPLVLRGKAKPFAHSRETSFAVKFLDCDLARYFAYLPWPRNFDLRSGRLDLDLLLTFEQRREKRPLLKLSGEAALRKVAVLDAERFELFGFERFGVSLVATDLLANIVHVRKLELTKPMLELRRDKEGRINLWRALELPDKKKTEKAAATALSGEIRVDGVGISGLRLGFVEDAGAGPQRRDLLDLPEFAVSGVSVDLGRRSCRIGKVQAASGTIGLERDKQGDLVLRRLLPPASPATDKPEPAESGQPWQVVVEALAVRGFSVLLTDAAPSRPVSVTLREIELSGRNLHTGPGEKSDLDLNLAMEGQGRLQAGGSFGLTPLVADLAVNVKGLPLAPLQNYLRDKVDVLVAGGNLDLTGRVGISRPEGGALAGKVTGSLAVNDLRLLDGPRAEPLFSCRLLQGKGLSYDLGDGPFVVGGIRLADFVARLAVDEKGVLNLRQVLKRKAAEAEQPGQEAAAPPAEPERPLQYRVEVVELAGGRIDFLDRKISPAYTSSLSGLRAEVRGLSSTAGKSADFSLAGKQDGHSPWSIQGSIALAPEDFAGNVAFRVADLDLTTLSPYSGRYIGRRIQKGKLFLDIDSTVEKNALTVKNRIFFDQLALGETVESPDALDLPLGLALTLLRNRKGEIHLNVPVSGNLDDPEFSLAGVIIKVFVNLIAKAATSPFALLGAILPGGEELQSVEFAPGQDLLEATALGKLETLAKVLGDRPGLKVELSGRVAAEADRPALHELMFVRLLKREKIKDTIGKGGETDLDAVVIGPEEYERYLWAAYKDADFKKERNFIGMVKELPAEEMAALLRRHISVSNDDLKLLADRRAARVREYLLGEGGVAAERVFLVAAGEGAAQVAVSLK
ncbi:DUF748 domain-containing protein [Thiovibrio sp. JS02]